MISFTFDTGALEKKEEARFLEAFLNNETTLESLKKLLTHALKQTPYEHLSFSFHLVFLGDHDMTYYNNLYRQKNKITNILSFSSLPQESMEELRHETMNTLHHKTLNSPLPMDQGKIIAGDLLFCCTVWVEETKKILQDYVFPYWNQGEKGRKAVVEEDAINKIFEDFFTSFKNCDPFSTPSSVPSSCQDSPGKLIDPLSSTFSFCQDSLEKTMDPSFLSPFSQDSLSKVVEYFFFFRFYHLLLHGFLHLLHYDHEDPKEAEHMEALEIMGLKALNYPNPYDEESLLKSANLI